MSKARPVEKFALVPQSQYDHMLKSSFRRLGGAAPSPVETFQTTSSEREEKEEASVSSPPSLPPKLPPPGQPVKDIDQMQAEQGEPRWVEVWQGI